MTFCRSIYVKKVMKLLAFIFEQPSYYWIRGINYWLSGLSQQVICDGQSKEESKDQELIQSSIPHLTQGIIWESDKNTGKHHKQESQEVSPIGDTNY